MNLFTSQNQQSETTNVNYISDIKAVISTQLVAGVFDQNERKIENTKKSGKNNVLVLGNPHQNETGQLSQPQLQVVQELVIQDSHVLQNITTSPLDADSHQKGGKIKNFEKVSEGNGGHLQEHPLKKFDSQTSNKQSKQPQLVKEPIAEVINAIYDVISTPKASSLQQNSREIEKIKSPAQCESGHLGKTPPEKNGSSSTLNNFQTAKKYLKTNDMDIQKLQKHEIWAQLNSNEQVKVQRFLADRKRHLCNKETERNRVLPKIEKQALLITEDQYNLSQNIIRIRNEDTLKCLRAAIGHEAQLKVILQLNLQNHFQILDFLDSSKSEPYQNFYSLLINAIQYISNTQQQVNLLVHMCGSYQEQILKPTTDLCCLALKFVANEPNVTARQVSGFLKFTFISKGNIHGIELTDIEQFDKKWQKSFGGFMQFLEDKKNPKEDILKSIPSTCLIFGSPFARILRTNINSLGDHIPGYFLTVYVQILAYSFEQDEQTLQLFMETVQQGFAQLGGAAYTTKFINLLSELLKEIVLKNKKWYCNMTRSISLLQSAVKIVKENKIECFSQSVCFNLLNYDEIMGQYLTAPPLINKVAPTDNQCMFKEILSINRHSNTATQFLNTLDISKPLLSHTESTFVALSIKPHFIQELAMKIIYMNETYNRMFLTIAPGLGKTKLIIAMAIHLVKTAPVFILNTNIVLLERDFNEASPILEKLNIKNANDMQLKAKITFLTAESFLKNTKDLPSKYHTILDEYQNIFFTDNLFEILSFLEASLSFTGLSGSSVNTVQNKLLQQCFKNKGLVLQLTQPNSLIKEEAQIVKTQKDQIKLLHKLSVQYRKLVPQIFILDESTASALLKGNKKHSYISLYDKGTQQINSILQNAFAKVIDNKNNYGTYIINEEMGTGTDFKTTTDIEKAGGIVLVFGIKLQSTSLFEQLSCRVGRIFNKGRRFYIIHDAQYVGIGTEYLQTTFNQLKVAEISKSKYALQKLRAVLNIDSDQDDQSIQTDIPGEIQNQQALASKTTGQETINTNIQFIDKINAVATNTNTIMKEIADDNSPHLRGLLPSEEESKNDGQIFPSLQNTIRDKKKNQEIRIEAKQTKDQTGKDLITSQEQNIQKEIIVEDQLKVENNEVKYDRAMVDAIIEKETDDLDAKPIVEALPNDAEMVDDSQKVQSMLSAEQMKQSDKDEVKNMLGKKNKGSKKRLAPEMRIVQLESEVIRTMSERQIAMVLQEAEKEKKKINPTQKIDDLYFYGYSKVHIHEEMLNDEYRCQQYQLAIAAAVKGKTALDLGSGSGILSQYAVKAGAASVTAVDAASVVDHMKKYLDEGMIDKFKFINKEIEKISEDELDQVDVIFSEWIGYFLLFENMIASFIIARLNFLKPGGTVIPSRAEMYLAAAEIDPLGTSAQPQHLRKTFKRTALIEHCPTDKLLQDIPAKIKEIDLETVKTSPLANGGFIQKFQMDISRGGTVNTFVGWFNVVLYQGINLSTSPQDPLTHWKQSIFFLQKPIKVGLGDILHGSIKMLQDPKQHRNMLVDITYGLEQSLQQKASFSFE